MQTLTFSFRVAGLLACVALASCSIGHRDADSLERQESAVTAVGSQPITSWLSSDGTIARTEFASNALTTASWDPEPKSAEPPAAPPSRIDSALAAAVGGADRTKMFRISIAVRSPRPFLPLPPLRHDVARSSPEGLARLTDRKAAFDAESILRAQSREPIRAIVTRNGGRVLEEFTLRNGLDAVVPAWLIERLLADERVVRIDPGDRKGRVLVGYNADARVVINSDELFNAGYKGTRLGYYVGVVDSGVLASHVLLSAPDRIDYEKDCVNGDSVCGNVGGSYDAGDTTCTGTHGHGTAMASVISGTANLDSRTRGISESIIDSFKVVTPAPAWPFCAADAAAFGRAMDVAVVYDEVINVSLAFDCGADYNCVTSLDAEDAVNAGAVVVAGVGNSRYRSDGVTPQPVYSPASAHRVLGIGAYQVDTGSQYSDQTLGPTSDGRFKPDVQMPMNFYGASTDSSTSAMVLGGTSTATAVAAGAAILVKDFYDHAGWSPPGAIYATLIALGTRTSATFDNTEGAGRTRLGAMNCSAWTRGYADVPNGVAVDVSFSTQTFSIVDADLSAGIWWPDGTTTHSDIDAYVLDASNAERGRGTLSSSVFEVVKVAGALTPSGSWKLRLTGYAVPGGSPQRVYYAIYRKSGCLA